MQTWYNVDEIAIFLQEYETLDTTKEARRLHAQQLSTVLDEMLLMNTTTASTQADAQALSSIGNVESEPTIIHVDEAIGATKDSLCSIASASKSKHSRHPTTISELMFAPFVGVGTVMIFLLLMSIAANSGCISIIQVEIQALVLAISCVYIIVSAIMKLRGTINGIHFNSVRDMCVTSIASITPYVYYIWHSICGQFMRSETMVRRLIGYFHQQFFVALECALSSLRHIRMRMELSSFVTSYRASFLGTISITSFVGSCIVQLQQVIQYIIDTVRKYSTVVPLTLEQASPSTVTYDKPKAGSRRSQKKGSTTDTRQGEVEDIMIHLLFLWTS